MRQLPMPDAIAHKDFVETQLANSLSAPDGVMFATDTPEKAKVVMDAIIGNCHTELRLMAKRLNRAVADPYQILKAIRKEKDLAVQIIVEMDDPFTCQYSALSTLAAEDPEVRGRIQVRHLTKPSPVHLSIGDEALARIHRNEEKPSTIVAFHNKDVLSHAVRRFAYVWGLAVPLNWPKPRSAPAPT
jgi:hypothetical protein